VEVFLFIGVVLVVAVALLWRSRAGVSRDVDAPLQGVPADGRNKFTTRGQMGAFHGTGDGDAGGGAGT
jgi:hypothetical protein